MILFDLIFFPLKLEDGVIIVFALAVCQMLEVKAWSQEKDLSHRLGTAGVKREGASECLVGSPSSFRVERSRLV